MQREPLFRTSPLLASLLTLCACTGDADQGAQGVILDSAVRGLSYRSGGLSGTTTANGTFEYEPGNSVELAVGELVLGSAQGRSRLTIVDLVPGAVDEQDPTVTNIARFLQTIDNDARPDNGIQVLKAVAALGTAGAIDFTLPVETFQVDPAVTNLVAQMTALTRAGQRPLIPAASARSHLHGTLMSILAGLYEGGYSGNETGNWQVYLGTDRTLTGWGSVTQTGEVYGLVGSVSSNGSVTFGNASDGSSFAGTIVNRSVTGDWESLLADTSGGFVGTQTVPAAASVPSGRIADVQGDYSGSFQLGITDGPLSLTIVANGDVTMELGSLRASAAIGEVVGNSVRVVGLAEDGTYFDGIADPFGELAGQLRNDVTGETGVFQGTKE